MIKLAQSRWGIVAIGCVCYLVVLALSLRGPVAAALARRAAAVAAPAPITGPSWDFHNPELEALVRELQGEKNEIARRRQQLEEWAARLQAERQELNTVTQAVHQMQVELDRNVVQIKANEKDNLKRLAKVYAGMTPESAVKILLEKDDEGAVKILASMKESEIAPILEAMTKDADGVKRAANISERLRLTLAQATPNKRTLTP